MWIRQKRFVRSLENDADPEENVCVATGYGRVSAAICQNKMITEITCHAMGGCLDF